MASRKTLRVYQPGDELGAYRVRKILHHEDGIYWKTIRYEVECINCGEVSEKSAEQLFHSNRKESRHCRKCRVNGFKQVHQKKITDRTCLPESLVGGIQAIMFIGGYYGTP